MRSHSKILAFAVSAFLSFAATAQTSGTYTIEGGSYSINVEFAPEGLKVVEPNKTSLYEPQGNGAYHFTNPTNGVLYGIRVIDAETIEAFKPGTSIPGTLLKLASAGAPADSFEENPESERYMELGAQYSALAQSDGDNAHVWSACGLAAFARATMSSSEAANQIRATVAMLKPIMVDTSGTPCADAIPAELW